MAKKAQDALKDTPPEWSPGQATSPKPAQVVAETSVVRTFETGANRDVDINKLDYEGFISPLVLKVFAEYMHKNRFLRDGTMRDSDNWQKGMPLDVLLKSLTRHFMSVWTDKRSGLTPTLDDLCGVLFNTQGLILQILRGEEVK